jgi:hypothetical protein
VSHFEPLGFSWPYVIDDKQFVLNMQGQRSSTAKNLLDSYNISRPDPFTSIDHRLRDAVCKPRGIDA